jgi:uncharacterized protein (UPF0303 family)
MTVEADLRIIAEQEQKLVFDRFNEDTAAEIGGYVREAANGIGKGLVVGVYLWDRTLFFGATAGASSFNRAWAERKAGLVRLMLKSSYRVVLERGNLPRVFEPNWAIEPTEYAVAGGAFPISVAGIGIVGAVGVSGLSERDDHEFGRSAVARALGLGADAFALPPV